MATYDYNYVEKPKHTLKTSYELAGLGERLIALIIDSMIVGFIGGLIFAGTRNGGGFAATFLIGYVYQWYFLTQQDGQTFGKMLMKIRVIKTDGQPFTATDALVRYIGYTINGFIFGLGWLWAAFDEDKQGWHDKLARTYVVKAE